MSSWYARQAVTSHREQRSRSGQITPVTRKSSTGRFQNAASVQCGPRRVGNLTKPATISLPTNDSRVELSQISMSQLTDATSYASQVSSNGKPSGSYNGYANSMESTARRGLSVARPRASERLRSLGRDHASQLEKFKQQSYRRPNTTASGIANHSQHPQGRSSFRVATTSEQVPGQRNPYLSTVSPYSKAFTSEAKVSVKHQSEVKSRRSSLFSGTRSHSNRTIATPRTSVRNHQSQSNQTIATSKTSVPNHHGYIIDQNAARNAKDHFFGCNQSQAQRAIKNRSAPRQASVHSRPDHLNQKVASQSTGSKPLGYTRASVPSTPMNGRPPPFSSRSSTTSVPQRNANATFTNKKLTTQMDSQLQDNQSQDYSENLAFSSLSTGTHGSVVERDIMRKAEEEVKRKVETGVEDKIRPLVSSLEDKQSMLYRRVSKVENHCQELLTSIETETSKLESRATNHITELESNFQEKTKMVMLQLEGEVSTKVADVLSKLEDQLAAKNDIGSELSSKIELAEKMLTMIESKVIAANGKVSTCLVQLDGRMTQAEKWSKKLKNLTDKVDRGVVTLKDTAAKGVASINETGASLLEKVQKTARSILGQPGFLRAKSPSPKQPSLLLVSPTAGVSSQENSMTSESMGDKAAKQNVKKSNTKPRVYEDRTCRSSKRKTFPDDELVDLTNSPRKKTRRHSKSLSSPTANIECRTPKANRRPLGKINRVLTKRRKSSNLTFNFGWDR